MYVAAPAPRLYTDATVSDLVEESDQCREAAFAKYDVDKLADLPETVRKEHFARYRKIRSLWHRLYTFYLMAPRELNTSNMDLSAYDTISLDQGTVDGFPSAEASDCDALRAVQVCLYINR